LSFILQFNLQNSYFILALPPPLGREKKLPSKATPGGRLGAGKVFDISLVSPEFPITQGLRTSHHQNKSLKCKSSIFSFL
jgi:hypothetical protein